MYPIILPKVPGTAPSQALRILRADLIPHLADARDYYKKDYESNREPRRTKLLSTIYCFDYLEQYLNGATYVGIAKKYNVSKSSVSKHCGLARTRIETYTKLKALNRL